MTPTKDALGNRRRLFARVNQFSFVLAIPGVQQFVVRAVTKPNRGVECQIIGSRALEFSGSEP